MLKFIHFKKEYSGQLVLSVDDLKFQKGVYWVQGENGSGKSTLLKAIAGIIPFEGEIELDDGYSLSENAVAYRRLVRYAEAEPVFPAFLKGADLIRYAQKIYYSDTAQIKQLAARLNITDFLNQKIASYSSGMLKKLALLMAFTGQPELILLDEPFTTLDQSTQKSLLRLIEEYAEGGTTFLITSHQPFTLQHTVKPRVIIVENKTLKLTEPYAERV